MVKKQLTSEMYTEKCQNKLYVTEKFKKVVVKTAQQKVLKAKLKTFRRTIHKRLKERAEMDKKWKEQNEHYRAAYGINM